ncbi:LysR family transcriptional regulator [Bacillus sp. BRMEA1]|uniref:LysR family transcriptional regulator n=1 Tax=Neobacillus endophyticus TaxID=2738405 RepID=UPI00156645E6|nr:LysR family transcriptional regulator [Neobacillus endophyticus]NRD79801.1 LysR family transcriptional regulator [Neobacillus endophyticus]
MDIKELITFKTIVETGTFSHAAKRLNYAQSTITTHIKKLEKDLGFLLFERGWDARLTDEGKLFAEEVEQLLMHWDYSITQAQRISKEEKGILRIGLLESVAPKLIQAILDFLNEQKPYLHCDFVIGNTALLSRMIDQNQLDFAVCGENINYSNLKFTPLCNQQIEFFVNNPDHPLLQKEETDVFEFIEYPILIGENSCISYRSVNAFLSENNLSFKRIYHCSALHLIPQLVTGDAIGIIPKGTDLQKCSIPFKVKGFDPEIMIGLLISKNKRNYLSHTKQELMNLVETICIE